MGTVHRYVGRMRLGVIDVGSNTVHLLVVDAHVGGHPLPASSHKIELRLAEHLEPDGRIDRQRRRRAGRSSSRSA